MPFVSSVRGTFSAQSKNKGVGTGTVIAEVLRGNPSAISGGTITEAGGFRIHRFTTTGASTFGTLGIASAVNVEVLVVAGGGGGGTQVGGGGGAGGLIYSASTSASAGTNHAVNVGAGGVGGIRCCDAATLPGDYGQNSSVFGFTAIRGGGGGCHPSGNRPISGDDGIGGGFGRPGGSGGGGAGDNTSTSRPGGSGTAGQGNSGGSGFVANPWSGGGGGGAGSAGSNAGSGSSGTNGAVGGNGLQYSITGSAQFYAAGGGGCNSDGDLYTTTRASGVGGRGTGFSTGGNQGNDNYLPERDAVANTGSGGGGTRDGSRGGNGSAGIVVIRYPI